MNGAQARARGFKVVRGMGRFWFLNSEQGVQNKEGRMAREAKARGFREVLSNEDCVF